MIRHSTEAIRAAAIKAGLSRAEAWVFTTIAYWEQVDGGQKRDAGENWRWRTYEEMAAGFGYSTKTVQRAVKSLSARNLIEVRRIQSPTRPGQTVNAYRLDRKGRAIVDIPSAAGIAQAVRSQTIILNDGEKTDGPVRTGQNDPSHKQTTKQNTVNKTKQREREKKGQDVSCWECFGGNEEVWEKLLPAEEAWFWAGYSKLIRIAFDESVGSFNPQREGWVRSYLSMFKEDGYLPEDAVQALIFTIRDWRDVSIDLFAQNTSLPEWRWQRKYPEPYDLGVLGHILFNHFREVIRDDFTSGNAISPKLANNCKTTPGPVSALPSAASKPALAAAHTDDAK